MSLSTLADDRKLTSLDQLEAYFRDGIKPSSEFRIGTEHEKFGWYATDASRPEYEQGGIQDVLQGFSAFGWAPIEEQGILIGMAKDKATITIEPGGQLELSGAPLAKIVETQREYDAHIAELLQISKALGLRWSGLGHFPTGDAEAAPLMPKPRYGILERRLRAVGGAGLEMMRQTATVQVNLDYNSEHDAMRKLRLGLMLHPIIIALYANSAFVNGSWSNVMSRRAQIWETTAPLRTRLPDVLYAPDARFSDYLLWSLEAPMLFVHREGRYVDCTGLSFRTFMSHGFETHQATVGDYALHLSTLFPDVRLKRFLEIRGADMGHRSQVLALPALFKGLFYSTASLNALDELFDGIDATSSRNAALSAAREGLDGTLCSQSLNVWAHKVVDIAQQGLQVLEPQALPYVNTLVAEAQRRLGLARDGVTSALELLEQTTLG